MRVILAVLFIVLFALACSKQLKTSAISNQEPSVFQDSITAVMIDQGTTLLGPCEPTICINPSNPEQILAGAILDKVYISNDGGISWSKRKLKSSHGVYGDPVLVANYQGDFFYSHLSNPTGRAYASEEFLDRIVIQRSSNGGLNWNDGSYTLPRSPKDQDKQWMAVDPKDNTLYITWTEFDLYDSEDPNHHSRILFSKSIDNADSWSTPIVLSEKEGNCLDDDQTTEGAVPCVGPEGQIYVSWSYDGKIYFDKSYDKGKSWLKKDIEVVNQIGGWTFEIPGIIRCNGMPITLVDRSNGPNHGHIYINWADQRNGKDNTDIWVIKSTDEGETWSAPYRVNDDNSNKHQFLSWMDIDQATGNLYVVFYDRRAHEDVTTDVYLAVSYDGGKHFINHKINSKSFKPNKAVFFGDYNDISVEGDKVRPIWTQLEGKKLSVWTALINL